MDDGLYIACWLTPEDAQTLTVGAKPAASLHLTLCYLGRLTDLPYDARARAENVTATVAATHPRVRARVAGVGVFRAPDRDCLVALIDAPDLECLRDCLTDALTDVGLPPVATHGFQPHIALAYLEPDQTISLPPSQPLELTLATVAVVSPSMETRLAPPRVDFPLAGLRLAKESPTADAVHVDRPVGSDEPPPKKRRRRKRHDQGATEMVILKADDEQQVVYGIVLQPDEADSQGDIVDTVEIEKAAWRFLYNRVPLALQHAKLAPDTVRPVESYLAPTDFTIQTPRGPELVRKGSWVVAAHVPDPAVWADVKAGRFTGWSIAGSGKRSPIAAHA